MNKAVFLPLLSLLLCGCWTSATDGEQLKTMAAARDARIEQLEAQSRENRQQLDGKVAKVENVLGQATELLTKDSADVGAQVDGMREQLSAQEGQIAELRNSLEIMTAEVGALRSEVDRRLSIATTTGPAIPADKEAHFATGYEMYEQKKYGDSRILFRQYLKIYPDDSKAGNAQYWIGATYHQEGKPATALGEYRKVISEHTESSAVNVALYGMADAFFRLSACDDAKAAIKTLLRRKPRAALSTRATALLNEIRKAPKTACE